ncbi:hypothetical protein [Pelagicoccus mobilis]|uniref:Uncharacterized protein n=1 Tax=Pelagicoccus mobilis TaxID=415221 RepID=A0A934VQG4_9BACT|nr:hypothetical protein [Pelagicoccus mobilis]MBK1876469.1 hypothetical protein [Pelagicoccus mobilis]
MNGIASELLKTWCDGMISTQIHEPEDPTRHGALYCPACQSIHGRCMDAVYPLLHMAKSTGQDKYLEAGIAVFEWSQNVSCPDGSWTVVADPNSWKGITVFGATALAEALHHHGDLLDSATRERWTERLEQAAEYVFKNFDLEFANINYGFSAIYALNLLGKYLNNPRYVERSKELAKGVKRYFTAPNTLIFGEAKPVNRHSARGLLPVDLGYNVEESLNGLALYAQSENDEELLDLIDRSLASHLEFMLPDGGWDNSWGTRQFKWTYWGSRTSDGCQITYSLLADRNAAFAKAAFKNTHLLQRCTSRDGLLYGGLHYEQEGIEPCVHHTFTHAKPLTFLLDHAIELKTHVAHLPREDRYGIRSFPEIATHLVSIGPWRGTITAYDFLYRPNVQQATGGALSLLWHEAAGLLCSASMAQYVLVEPHNQQTPSNPEDLPLTPRLECERQGQTYSNLFDLSAEVTVKSDSESTRFDVDTHLTNDAYVSLPNSCHLSYRFAYESVSIEVEAPTSYSFVLPIISSSNETIDHTDACEVLITKQKSRVRVRSNNPISVGHRFFNLVPGLQAVPIKAKIEGDSPLVINISVDSI